ncbi:hypothetical protein LSAT2_014061 [Lamellibrachia satsuma]|nr:hypothetical protein LSAT2_014061 [Lamellibrachia satsuma]
MACVPHSWTRLLSVNLPLLEKSLEIQSKLLATTPKKGKTQDKDLDGRMSFTCRFPQATWMKAQDYFQCN